MLLPLNNRFFEKSTVELARALLRKVICARYQTGWLRAMIVETEAYELTDKASHASLGYTTKRKALFMPAGTIYMYYARGKDSFNISAQGEGNAVLIKAGIPYLSSDVTANIWMLRTMRELNPHPHPLKQRAWHRLCAGQTLLCRALALQVPIWDQQTFNPDHLYLADSINAQASIIQTTRLGIPTGRDQELPWRFIDTEFAHAATHNPLSKRIGLTHQAIWA